MPEIARQKPENAKKKKGLPRLDTVPNVCRAMATVIRSMWSEQISSADGSRIANALSLLLRGLQDQQIEQIKERLDRLEGGHG
jgi:hypothetical protein